MTGNESVDLGARDGRNVILMDEDGYYWAAAMAESIAASGRQLTIVTRFFEAFREIPVVSRIAMLREMDRRGAALRPNMFVARAANGSVVLSHYLTGREEIVEGVAAIVWVGNARPSGRLAEELRELGSGKLKVHVVGDAFSPRRLSHALVEAHAAGRAVGFAA